MATQSIYYVIDKYREFLRQISDDSVYTDEFLYAMLIQSRAEIIKNTVDNNKELSPWLYQRFCIKLCPSNFVECSCVDVDFGCKVWRSEKPIPEFLYQNDNLMLNISELYGSHINQLRERSFRTVKYRKNQNKFYYIIADLEGNKHLFIMSLTDNVPPKYMKAEGVLVDPSDIDDFTCDGGDCFDPLGSGFNLDLTKHNALFKMTTEMLGVTMKMIEDRSNDADSVNDTSQI